MKKTNDTSKFASNMLRSWKLSLPTLKDRKAVYLENNFFFLGFLEYWDCRAKRSQKSGFSDPENLEKHFQDLIT